MNCLHCGIPIQPPRRKFCKNSHSTLYLYHHNYQYRSRQELAKRRRKGYKRYSKIDRNLRIIVEIMMEMNKDNTPPYRTLLLPHRTDTMTKYMQDDILYV